ncbi:uncharacterized protein CBL_02315 [Carabus blaptoides fortunei]
MCADKLMQPFIEGLKNAPDRRKDINKVRNWMQNQAHLPQISDEFIHLFLHACFYSVDKTKHCIESYFTIRTNNPFIFGNRDLFSDSIQTMMSLAHMARLPRLTPEGHRILVYRLADPDYRKMVFSEGVKAFCMVNDVILSEDGLVDGYIIVFDMKGVQLGHLARVSLPALRVFMHYIQDAHPARLKAIHVLHTASWINHVMRLLIPLARSDIMSILKFHQGSVPDGVPLELLPEDYGGNEGLIERLHSEQYAMMIEKYQKWLLEGETLKVDESKRAKKSSWLSIFTSSSAKDEPGFKNLAEID